LATLSLLTPSAKEAATFESRTAQRETNVIREVFISATAKDAADYRTQVGDALAQLSVAVFLQEYWAFAAQNVVDLCLTRLAESDAYLGVFGFRYGWIPDRQVKSITELECDRALQLWGNSSVPPVFWFMPEPNSDAARLLDEAAATILELEYPNDVAARAKSRELQKAFCDRLRGMNRFVMPFSTLQMLRERAMAAVSNWNQVILKAAAEKTRTAVAEIPPGELGAIDRSEQREAIESTLLAAQAAGTPGVCIVVHGDEGAGQFQFLAFLEQQNLWDISARPHPITPSHDQFDAVSLAGAALSEIAPGQTVQTAIFDDLAAALADACRIEPVVMFVNVDRLIGGLDAFRTGFWLPLITAAQTRARILAQANPFIVVLRSSTPVPSPLAAGLIDAPPGNTFDYRDLVVLPALGRFTRKDVFAWLGTLDVKLKDRNAIADRVTGDGSPRGVFDRLNSDGFWTALNR
jgi:hypothetical protein